MKKRIIVVMALLIASVMVLSACRSDEAAGGNMFTIVTASLPVNLNHTSNDSPSAQVTRHIYDTLVYLCYDTFDPQPRLALNWSQPDAQTVVMELRQGVYFHNGDPLTAHDVKFSIDRAAVNPHAEAITGMISHVTVQDDYNFTIHLDVPFAPIIRHLGHTITGILPAAYYEEVGADAFREAPVGTGPFMFYDWVSGDRITLVRNDNYWDTPANVEYVQWREVPDASTRLIAVETGEANLALGISAADLPVAAASPNVNLLRRQTLSTDYLGFNCTAPYLENVLVRQAIAYALDTAAIFDAVWGEFGSLPAGPLSSIVWGYHAVERYEQNIERARELLAEAGYADGFSTRIWWNTGNPQRMNVAEIVAATLRQINIDVEVVALEWGTILAGTERGEHDMFIMGWVSVTGDADYGLYPLFHSSMHGPNNRSFFSYEPLDVLLDAGRQSVDPDERLAIYAEAQQIVRDQAPWVFLRQGEDAVAVGTNVRGFVINPGGHHNYTQVYFE